jgi:hypothetical protein
MHEIAINLSDRTYKIYNKDDSHNYNTENAHVKEVGNAIYAVIVNYDTGDSFSQTRDQECFVDAFTSHEAADALAKLIVSQDREKTALISYINDEGNETSTSTYTWTGYFETFNFVEVVSVMYGTRRYYN